MHADVINLAWDLAEAVKPLLGDDARVALFAALGAGESDVAIESLLGTCRSARIQLSNDLLAQIDTWADAYHVPDVRLLRYR